MSYKDMEAKKAEMMAMLEQSKAQSNDPNFGRKTIGNHVIVKLIGAGGMGLAYLAIDPDPGGGKAVVKTLKPEFAGDAELRARFQQEAVTLEEMTHIAIPHVKYIDRSQEPWLLVMEYCEGDSLSDYLHHNHDKRRDRDFQKAILRAMYPVIDALALGHSKNIIHRDIKPDNIIVMKGPNGELFMKLLDFGIAKTDNGPVQTCHGAILGTPGYLSPEQIMKTPVTKVSDVYALGAVFYEIFAGHPFIEPNDSWYVMNNKAMEPLYCLQRLRLLPIHIRALVGMMVAIQPEDRFGGLYEVEGALRFVMKQMEIENRKILRSEAEEMEVIIDLTRNNMIDGRLEQIGAQRVMKRQFEIKQGEIDTTQEVPAIQDEHLRGNQLPSVEIPAADSFFGASPQRPSNPDISYSDIRAAQQAAQQTAPKPSLAPASAVSIVAEPGSGGTIMGLGGEKVVPASVQAPAAIPVPSVSGTRELPPKTDGNDSSGLPHAQTLIPGVPVPNVPVEEVFKQEQGKKSSAPAIVAGVSIGILLLAVAGTLFWTGRKKPDDSGKKESVAAADVPDAALNRQQADTFPDAAASPLPAPPPDAFIQYDASAAPPAQSVEDSYKALEDACRTSERGRKLWDAPNFRLYCVKMEAFKIEDLDKRLQLLRYNKNKYCRPGLRHYERGDPNECKSHARWIKDTVDKIWAREHPDWRPPPPKKNTSKKPPPRSKPKPRR